MPRRLGPHAGAGQRLPEQPVGHGFEYRIAEPLRGGETGPPGSQLVADVPASPQVSVQRPRELPHEPVPTLLGGDRLRCQEAEMLHVEPRHGRRVVAQPSNGVPGRRFGDGDGIAVRVQQALPRVCGVEVETHQPSKRRGGVSRVAFGSYPVGRVQPDGVVPEGDRQEQERRRPVVGVPGRGERDHPEQPQGEDRHPERIPPAEHPVRPHLPDARQEQEREQGVPGRRPPPVAERAQRLVHRLRVGEVDGGEQDQEQHRRDRDHGRRPGTGGGPPPMLPAAAGSGKRGYNLGSDPTRRPRQGGL